MKTEIIHDMRTAGKGSSAAHPDAADRLMFWCPACEAIHVVTITGKDPWQWNGDREVPTITPSVRTFSGAMEAGRRASCHLQLTDGKLSYYTDSYKMAGQTVDLPHLPPGLVSR